MLLPQDQAIGCHHIWAETRGAAAVRQILLTLPCASFRLSPSPWLSPELRPPLIVIESSPAQPPSRCRDLGDVFAVFVGVRYADGTSSQDHAVAFGTGSFAWSKRSYVIRARSRYGPSWCTASSSKAYSPYTCMGRPTRTSFPSVSSRLSPIPSCSSPRAMGRLLVVCDGVLRIIPPIPQKRISLGRIQAAAHRAA